MKSLWINNRSVPSDGKPIPVVNPADEALLDEAPDATREEVSRAVAAAKAAFPKWWKDVSAHEKAELLHEISRRFKAKSSEIARTMTLEGGKPLRENQDEIGWVASCFDYYAELQRNNRGRVIPSVEPSQLAMVLKEPYGVVGCIVPWNYPLLLLAWKVAPALAAGNTIVIKPAEQTPLSTLMLSSVFECLPPGVVNIVTGRGQTAGDALVRHPDVAMIAFTGSLETGKAVGRICADLVKKCHLELGGKDPFVVAEDSDIEIATRAVAWAAFLNTGQVCTSSERIYVHKSIAEEFIAELHDFTKGLVVGPGMHPDTDIGPMIGGENRKKVEAHVLEAVKRGARVIQGGRRPPHLKKGYFYEPTILTDVNHSMQVMRDETFGPVCPIMTYKEFDEAIALANDTQFGLGAVLYTNDPKKAKRFFESVQAGTIWINDPLTDNDAGPFGGYKATGGHRELGEEGLEAFRQTKHVHWDFEQTAKPWWYPYGEKSLNIAAQKLKAAGAAAKGTSKYKTVTE
ncbi:MAG: aldehyde dehydrogenase [Elusimicrobia bacterium]|nr:aldehyde dehydrogenase [Elusimicrobiota bacterium]